MNGPSKQTNILIVDDNQTAATALATLLAHKGHVVATAFDGNAAIAIAEEFRPRAIILDLDLPGKSGYDVAREVRRRLPLQTLLIALSGYGQREHKRLSQQAGFDYHLTKPILVAELEEFLNASRIDIKTGSIIPRQKEY